MTPFSLSSFIVLIETTYIKSIYFYYFDTKDCVGPHFKTPQSLSKILCYMPYFHLSFWCLEM